MAVLLATLVLAGTLALPAPPEAPEVWVWSDSESAAARGPDGASAEMAGAGPAVAAVLAFLETRGLPFHEYPHLDMVAFVAPAAQARALVAHAGGRIDANEAMDLHLDRSVAYIEADRVRDAVGLRRDGPTVMVVDTGVDSAHPDFEDGQNLAANVQADRQGGLVTGVLDNQPVVDLAGHGTHVAGIVAGSGASLGQGDPLHGTYTGLYANGRIAGFQASTDDSEDIRVDTVAALEAFDWAIANRDRYDIRVVTNSWGLPGEVSEDHPVNQATLRLYLQGMNVVFSAGNLGEAGTLNKYCVMPWVLCVAAGDLQGARSRFSSYGGGPDPDRPWDHPDLTAPGHFITSADPPAQGGLVGGTLRGQTSEGLYRDRSGTSMAAPHVAGVAALLLAANPRLGPDQVMDILVGTTDPMADDEHRVGSGYLNARKAYNLAVQTAGNREDFLEGQAIKYAGSRSRDAHLANDPVSQGYDGDLVAGPTLPPEAVGAWVLTPMGGALALSLLLASLLNVLLGLRFRRRLPRAQRQAADSSGAKAEGAGPHEAGAARHETATVER